MLHVEIAGASDIGRVRRNNEDAYAWDAGAGVAVVADGMGGAACGEVASQLTIDEILDCFRRVEPGADPQATVLDAVRRANACVATSARSAAACSGMGSTVVVARWRERRLWVANVGDSRAYRLRNGRLEQLSYDQNVANELRQQYGFSEEQIRQYPHRNALTMAIGTQPVVSPYCVEDVIAPGDLLLLCTDGLSGPVTDAEIARLLGAGDDLETTARNLVAAANAAGGPDNVTCVLIRFTA